jgi:hypothetical protein
MIRIGVMSIFAALLASCSGSNRIEDIVPEWANTPERHPATQYAIPKDNRQGRGTVPAEPSRAPAAEGQQRKRAEGQSPPED